MAESSRVKDFNSTRTQMESVLGQELCHWKNSDAKYLDGLPPTMDGNLHKVGILFLLTQVSCNFTINSELEEQRDSPLFFGKLINNISASLGGEPGFRSRLHKSPPATHTTALGFLSYSVKRSPSISKSPSHSDILQFSETE